jgi:hypothetical protein
VVVRSWSVVSPLSHSTLVIGNPRRKVYLPMRPSLLYFMRSLLRDGPSCYSKLTFVRPNYGTCAGSPAVGVMAGLPDSVDRDLASRSICI